MNIEERAAQACAMESCWTVQLCTGGAEGI